VTGFQDESDRKQLIATMGTVTHVIVMADTGRTHENTRKRPANSEGTGKVILDVEEAAPGNQASEKESRLERTLFELCASGHSRSLNVHLYYFVIHLHVPQQLYTYILGSAAS
jgi:hypothetical protein